MRSGCASMRQVSVSHLQVNSMEFPHMTNKFADALKQQEPATDTCRQPTAVRACPLRIDMLSDSTRDRCPSEASAHWRSTSVAAKQSDQPTAPR